MANFNFDVVIVDDITRGFTAAATNQFDIICTHIDKLPQGNNLASLRNSKLNQNTQILAFTKAVEQSILNFHDHNNVYFLDADLSAHALESRLQALITIPGESPKKIVLDTEKINVFIDSCIETFKTMTQAKRITASNALPLSDINSLDVDISGYAFVQSQSFQGYFSICFPKNTFLNTVNKMLGTDYTEMDPDIYDATNELNNIIYGQVKKTLTFQGFKLAQVSPAYTLGKDKVNELCSSCPSVYIPFESDHGTFYIVIGIHGAEEQEQVQYANAG